MKVMFQEFSAFLKEGHDWTDILFHGKDAPKTRLLKEKHRGSCKGSVTVKSMCIIRRPLIQLSLHVGIPWKVLTRVKAPAEAQISLFQEKNPEKVSVKEES